MRILGNVLPFVAHVNKPMTGLTMPDAQKSRRLGNKSCNENSRLKSGSSYMTTFSHHCVVCGEDDPAVLEFDHVDQSTKDKAVSNMVVNSIAKIKTEIEKCRVLCANCHKRHTATQLGWYKDLKK